MVIIVTRRRRVMGTVMFEERDEPQQRSQMRQRARKDADSEFDDGPDGDFSGVGEEILVVEEGEEKAETDEGGGAGAVSD